MWIDKIIEKTKCDALIGMYSSLTKDDKDWLIQKGYIIEKQANGVFFRININK